MSPPRAPGENPSPITRQVPRVWRARLQSARGWSWASVLPGPSVRSRGRGSRAFASALPFALGKHEVGKRRVRHTPRGKFRPGSLEKWIGDQKTPKSPGQRRLREHPSRAAHRTHRCRSPAPPSPGAERPAAVACPRGSATGRTGSNQPATEDAEQAEPSAYSPASAATRRESRATLRGRGGGEVEGCPVPPACTPCPASASSHGSAPPAGQARIGVRRGPAVQGGALQKLAGDLVPMEWPAPRGYLKFPKGSVASRGPTQRAVPRRIPGLTHCSDPL